MRLTYDHKLRLYIFECYPSEKDIPKSAGFTYNPIKINKKVWYTSNIYTAMKLAKYADKEVRDIFSSEMKLKQINIEQSRKETTERVFKAPEGLQYYPFQAAGIEFMINHPKTLLSDFLGGGKTIEVIGLINNTNVEKVLIICPNTIKLNWKIELEKWLCKKLSISVLYAQEYKEADIMIINYNIINKYSDELSEIKFDLVVCDESHALKNAKTIRFNSYRKISKNIPRKVFMTGTPILNRPAELWTTIQELCPNEFGSFWQFGKEYCGAKQVKIGYNREKQEPKYAWDFSGASNLDRLQMKLRSSCMIRRSKDEVLKELPNITRQIILLDDKSITEREKILFEEAKQDYVSQVNDLKVNSLGFFEMLSKIRHKTALEKVPYVIEFVEELLENDEKVVLFGHHKDVLGKFKQKWPNAAMVTGDTPSKERQKAIDSFQGSHEVRVFIGSIQASSTGITLTKSSKMVFAELDWCSANIVQCEARIARIGQKYSVNVYHLVLDGTIDAHLAKTIIRKQEISDKTLDLPINLKEIFGF